MQRMVHEKIVNRRDGERSMMLLKKSSHRRRQCLRRVHPECQ